MVCYIEWFGKLCRNGDSSSFSACPTEDRGITCVCSEPGQVKGSPSLSFPRCAAWLETQKFSDWAMSKKLKIICSVPGTVNKKYLF